MNFKAQYKLYLRAKANFSRARGLISFECPCVYVYLRVANCSEISRGFQQVCGKSTTPCFRLIVQEKCMHIKYFFPTKRKNFDLQKSFSQEFSIFLSHYFSFLYSKYDAFSYEDEFPIYISHGFLYTT